MVASNDNLVTDSDLLLKKAQDMLIGCGSYHLNGGGTCALLNGGQCPLVKSVVGSVFSAVQAIVSK